VKTVETWGPVLLMGPTIHREEQANPLTVATTLVKDFVPLLSSNPVFDTPVFGRTSR